MHVLIYNKKYHTFLLYFNIFILDNLRHVFDITIVIVDCRHHDYSSFKDGISSALANEIDHQSLIKNGHNHYRPIRSQQDGRQQSRL